VAVTTITLCPGNEQASSAATIVSSGTRMTARLEVGRFMGAIMTKRCTLQGTNVNVWLCAQAQRRRFYGYKGRTVSDLAGLIKLD
jgi:hypothetical protein